MEDLNTHGSLEQWWIMRALPAHERCVELLLSAKGVEYYCPRYERRSRRVDRQQVLRPPLFPGYVFARFAWDERKYATDIMGLQRTPLLQFGSVPAMLEEREIAEIRLMEENHAVPWNRPAHVGDQVRVISGPFHDFVGYVVREHGRQFFVLRFDTGSISIERDNLEVVFSHRAA